MATIAKRFEAAIGTADLSKTLAILKEGVNPNEPFKICDEKIYPLVHAIATQEIEIVKALLNYGAEVEITWHEHGKNWTPITYAHQLNNKEIEELLASKVTRLMEYDDWIEAWTERCHRTQWQ